MLRLPEMIRLFADRDFAPLADALVGAPDQRLWLRQHTARQFGAGELDPTASSSRPSSRSSSVTPAARTHCPPSETGPQPCTPSSSARTSASQPDSSPTWQYPPRWCSASATTTSVPISPATSPTCSYDLGPALSRTRPTGPSGTGARRNNAHHRLRRARLVDLSRRPVESTDPRPSTSPSVRREPRSGSRQHSKQGQHTKSQPSGSTHPGPTAWDAQHTRIRIRDPGLTGISSGSNKAHHRAAHAAMTPRVVVEK
jgi:hypothetical protein